jgi:hypothetical protein
MTGFRWPAWLNAISLLIVSFVAVSALSLQVRPGSEVVAVAFTPWRSTQDVFSAVASAKAMIVRTTAISFVLIVQPNRSNGLERLRDVGVWLTIDPQAVAACFTNKPKDI